MMLVSHSISVFTALLSCYGHSNNRNSALWNAIHNIVVPSFGAGAILATVVFLLVPESLLLLGGGHADEEDEHMHDETETAVRFMAEEEAHDDHSGESEAAWKFGTAFLGGLFFLLLLHALIPHPEALDEDCEVCNEEQGVSPSAVKAVQKDEEAESVKESDSREVDSNHRTLDEGCDAGECEHEHDKGTATVTVSKKPLNWALISSIIIGDAFHNFADGVFIGTAFLLCDDDLAFTLVATTVYHEVAQEIADHSLLTHHGGLSPLSALLLNFVAGFSLWLGAILTLSIDMSDATIGIVLAFSAGVYVYLGGSECIPRIQQARKNLKDVLVFAVSFVLGAVPIGLVLLNHSHCEAHGEHHDEHDENHDEAARLVLF